ncbi:MAG: tetratricopeptide repeat protein [Chitinispirillaceae bacterium]|nr:tetratricopeptide repeat protein [Chitinispirillaceae bacterium]
MLKKFHNLFQRVYFITIVLSISGQFFLSSAAGLPEEYLVTQRWRTLFSASSPLTNPSFINEENYLSLRGVYTSILNEFITFEAGGVYPIGLYQSVGLTVAGQGLRESYVPTDIYFDTIAGGEVTDNTYYIMGTYAYNLWSGLTLGANINLLLNSFYNQTSVGISPDLGLTLRLLQHPLIGTHQLGVALQNAIYLGVTKGASNLPRVARFSLNSNYLERQIVSTFDFSIRDIGVAGSNFIEGKPAQIEWNLDGKIGGWILRIIDVYGLFGITEEAFSYLGLAGGVNIPMINNGRDISFLVQYLYMAQVKDKTPGSFISMYVRGEIGKHREEIYARKMARLANLEPNELYIKACELYAQGNYWDAFFIFSRLFVEYPEFFKNDWVSFFLGSCQEMMDMRLTAEEAYNKTKELYPRSAAVPFSDLGLMRVYYRDANFGAVETQFNELNKLGVPDSIKYHGYYYMGETEMKKGSFSKAKQLFDLIPETHPDYVFAQHSAAICDASTDNIEGALSSLENCIQAQVTTDAQMEMVNRSYVFIGYIFYEELTKQEGPLAKAVTALRMVPKTSYFYTDALLGLGWTALKARQWTDCKNAGQELAATSDNPVMKAEGGLLQAYAFMMEKNYNQAATLLAAASKELETFQAPSQAELMSRQDESNALRGKYTDVARKAYDLGTSRQSDIVIKQIDSLHTHQKDFKTEIDEFLKYVDRFERVTFFSRNYESIKEDVDYALAKSQKLGGQVKETQQIEKFQKQDTKLDSELEQLKKQLEAEEKKMEKKESKKEAKEVTPKEEPAKKEPKKVEPKKPEPAPLPTQDFFPEEPPEEEGWE